MCFLLALHSSNSRLFHSIDAHRCLSKSNSHLQATQPEAQVFNAHLLYRWELLLGLVCMTITCDELDTLWRGKRPVNFKPTGASDFVICQRNTIIKQHRRNVNCSQPSFEWNKKYKFHKYFPENKAHQSVSFCWAPHHTLLLPSDRSKELNSSANICANQQSSWHNGRSIQPFAGSAVFRLLCEDIIISRIERERRDELWEFFTFWFFSFMRDFRSTWLTASLVKWESERKNGVKNNYTSWI